MSFNITEFISNINASGGTAPAYAFAVRLHPPASIIGQLDPKHFFYRVDAAPFPGRAIITSDVRYGTFPIRKHATGPTYIEVTTSIILSADFRERDAILAWQDLAVGGHRKFNGANRTPFNTGYYDDYRGRVEVMQYAPHARGEGDWAYKVTLIDAYPVLVNQLEGSWESPEQHRMQVTWTYHYMEDEYREFKGTTVPPVGSLFNRIFEEVGRFSGLAGNALETL